MSNILITGACGAVGSKLAKALCPHHQLWLLDLDPLALNRLDDEIRAINPSAEPYLLPFDLWRLNFDRYQKTADLIQQALAEHQLGTLDTLIHCASFFNNLTPISHVSPEVWLQSLQVNLTAVQWLNQVMLPLLQSSTLAGGGKIIFTTHPEMLTEQSVYWHGFGAAQSALGHLVREWQAEAESLGIAVHEVGLPWLDSPQSRNVFPAAKASWTTPHAIVHRYLEILS